MGGSEWGFPLYSQDQLLNLLDLVKAHNLADPSTVGEKITVGGILRHNGKYYLFINNGGGRDLTTAFFERYYQGVIYYPFSKPVWWHKCQDYAWKCTPASPEPRSIF